MIKNSFPRNNNLEWLRLIFAIQVVFDHLNKHMGWSVPEFIHYFPGVPAFFFVSGFLIYASYLNSGNKNYFYNRFLRLFPGLFIVTLGGLCVVLIAHGSKYFFENIWSNTVWFFAQTTLGQAYNPSSFRDIGVGVINGSLWTITVEVIFYLTVPVIVWMEKRSNATTYILFVLSFVVYAFGPEFFSTHVYREKSFYDILALTPLPWGWMFIAGIWAFKNFNLLSRYIKYVPLLILPLLIIFLYGDGNNILFGFFSNRLGLIYFFVYVAFIMYAAFCTPYKKLNFDISYGAYIWHMPIINLLLVLNVDNPVVAILLTGLVSLLSWFLVEKRFINFKRKTIK